MIIKKILLSCIAFSFCSAVFAQRQIILDDKDAEKVGKWEEIADATAWAKSYHRFVGIRTTTPTASLRWKPMVPVHGIYDLYYWNPKPNKGISKRSAVQVFCQSGKQDYTINQERKGSNWVYLGTNEWVKGNAGIVEWQNIGDGNDDTSRVTADGLKLVQTGEVLSSNSSDNRSSTWLVTSLPAAEYEIYFQPLNRIANIKLEFKKAGITPLIKLDSLPVGQWTYIGSRKLATGTEFMGAANLKGGLIKLVKPHSGTFKITNHTAQTILGLGVEIQSDGFGPNYINSDVVRGVPHELVSAERDRFATEMLKGFRYLRLAMGLWFRGQTPDNKNIIERYPGQVAGLHDMVKKSGIEGLAVEYWSPPVYWKASGKLPGGGSLKNYSVPFLDSMGMAMVQDLDYLSKNGLKPVFWSLQNEPSHTEAYSSLKYNDLQYYQTFKQVAPQIKRAYPDIFIYNDSLFGQEGIGSDLIKKDPSVLKYVDGWAWHRIGKNANEQIDNREKYNAGREGRPVLNNEYEYFLYQVDRYPQDWRMVNTAQSIMNWFTFENSPTWTWLHALKPIKDANLEGFALGVFRPQDDNDLRKYPNLEKGHFEYLWSNWHALAGFLKHMPWNSVRRIVDEDQVRHDQRIMAWTSPDGKPGFVLTNRSSQPFIFRVKTDGKQQYRGYMYNKQDFDKTMLGIKGETLIIRAPAMSIIFYTAK